jgi:hypothetical protein
MTLSKEFSSDVRFPAPVDRQNGLLTAKKNPPGLGPASILTGIFDEVSTSLVDFRAI